MNAEWLPAVVLAGGKLDSATAAKAGTDLAAAVALGGRSLLARTVSSLRESGRVHKIVVVGPKGAIENEARQVGADDVLEEAGNAARNIDVGLTLLRSQSNTDRVLLVAADLPFLTAQAVRAFLDSVKPDPADILLPVGNRADLENLCPRKPGTYAKLSGGEVVPASLLLVRPSVLERNQALFRKMIESRNNPTGAASALGFLFVVKYFLGMLTAQEVERKISTLTGSSCKSLMGADARLCADIGGMADYDNLVKSFSGM
ncbi:MAG: nucleotidyltransferase family protein [Capsulimonadales bacterium]|nr:nucleotidyltransferase family protein [Capsulimonadales bacterium]